VPLNITEEIGVAWNSFKSIDEIGINPAGLLKLIVVDTLAPFLCDGDNDKLENYHYYMGKQSHKTSTHLEAKFVVGIFIEPRVILHAPESRPLQMEPSHNVVQGVPNNMHNPFHQILAVSNTNLFHRIGVGSGTDAAHAR